MPLTRTLFAALLGSVLLSACQTAPVQPDPKKLSAAYLDAELAQLKADMLDWVPLNDKGEIHTWQIEQTRLLECSPWKPGKSALGRGLCMARKEDLNAAELQALGEQLKVLSALADDYGLLAQQYRSGALDRAAYIAAAQRSTRLWRPQLLRHCIAKQRSVLDSRGDDNMCNPNPKYGLSVDAAGAVVAGQRGSGASYEKTPLVVGYLPGLFKR